MGRPQRGEMAAGASRLGGVMRRRMMAREAMQTVAPAHCRHALCHAGASAADASLWPVTWPKERHDCA
eukprot:NODE_12529_length_259_cov_171.254902.p1 GENE.NODE_12529_length_259_cov_171.254902~~NODE_12529_length_259_cov_171.254902.p1  ORF type:complete len:68 (-),score=2.76 NODE_12529_length_259_cov_171.254902:38-241(-)